MWVCPKIVDTYTGISNARTDAKQWHLGVSSFQSHSLKDLQKVNPCNASPALRPLSTQTSNKATHSFQRCLDHRKNIHLLICFHRFFFFRRWPCLWTSFFATSQASLGSCVSSNTDRTQRTCAIETMVSAYVYIYI